MKALDLEKHETDAVDNRSETLIEKDSRSLHNENSSSSELFLTPLINTSNKISFQQWLNECAWPGMGLFGESYLLFSIGILKPLWESLYPQCFAGTTCSSELTRSLTTNVVLGVIFGMILIGSLANIIGRRAGSLTTASLMAFSALGMLWSSLFLASNAELLFQSMSVLLFIFGVGVGGEYPLSASSASEKSMVDFDRRRKAEQQKRLEKEIQELQGIPTISESTSDNENDSRQEHKKKEKEESGLSSGRRVLLVFTMQGLGIFVNTLVITSLLWLTRLSGKKGNKNNDGEEEYNYSAIQLLDVWRISYAIGAAILSYVLVSRLQYLTESEVWVQDKIRRQCINRQVSYFAPKEKKKPGSRPVDTVETVETVETASEKDSEDGTPRIHMAYSDVSALSNGTGFGPTPRNFVTTTTGEEDLQTSAITLLMHHYGHRLFGSSAAWLLWDVAFYGNKLFQSSFLLALTGDNTTLLELSAASALNAFIALLGYFAAAAIIDHPSVGRLKLQQYGFLMTGILFLLCGVLYSSLSSGWLMIFYLGSSFFGQCGPNATTFLIPAEIFPTEMRTMCHGIAAASGKIGALIASVAFAYAREEDLFLASGYASFGACIITFMTIPDTTKLDLFETDKKWRLILAGRKAEYNGDANKPQYLSFYERQMYGYSCLPDEGDGIFNYE